MTKTKSHSFTANLSDFYFRWRFSILLMTLLLLNVCRLATFGLAQDRFVFDVCGVAVFVATTLSLCARHKTRLIGLVLGLPTITLLTVRSTSQEFARYPLMIAARIACIVFLAFVIGLIIVTLLKNAQTSRDSIAGAFCGYLLIGVMFAEAFCLLELVQPNSFKIDSTASAVSDQILHTWLSLEYFSFTTLTTLGFGDIVPITPQSRFLAVWEAICGQFYLAVLVAGLVNLRASEVGSHHGGAISHSEHHEG